MTFTSPSLHSPKATPPSAESRRTSPILSHKPLSVEEAFGPPPHLRDQGATNASATPYDNPMNPGGGGGGRDNRPQRGMMGGAGGDRPPRFNNQGQQQQYQQQGQGQNNFQGGPKRDLSTVTCFRCDQTGHYANNCPNPMKPGNRGGLDRPSRGRG